MSELAISIMEPEKDLINIPLYYEVKKKKNGSRQIDVLEDEEGKKKWEEMKAAESSQSDEEGEGKQPVSKVEVLNTKWKRASWSEQNNILRQAQKINMNTQQPDIDWGVYRDMRIKSLLVDWDMEHNGEKIPVQPEIIDKLPADIVLAIFDKYERSINLDDEEMGK